MTTDYEEIRRLYMERLAGLFTEADESKFRDLLEHDNYAGEIVRLLDDEFKNSKAGDFIAGIAEEKALIEVKDRLSQAKEIKIKRFNRQKWMVAAALLLMSGLAVLLYERRGATENIQSVQRVPNRNGIQLKLSDGKSVELSSDLSSKTIVVGGVEMVTSNGGLQSVRGEASAKINTLIVPPAKEYQIVLDDGTKVWLNSASELHFPFRFSAEKREITILGEAYFEVAKDINRPFIVNAGNIRVEVLGTHFNVNAYAGRSVKTSLLEGKVRLTAEGIKPIQLTEGYEAEYLSGKGFVSGQFDPENALSWMNGSYYFHDQKLSEISQVIANWFDIRVVFDNPDLKRYEITGLLEKGQLQNFVKDLETSAQISYRFEGKVLHLNKK